MCVAALSLFPFALDQLTLNIRRGIFIWIFWFITKVHLSRTDDDREGLLLLLDTYLLLRKLIRKCETR
jgi:hypothetical protein